MSIAVIIPFYKAYAFLEEAVQSCLQQREVAEILLINDHSTDQSPEIAVRLANQHPIIRVLATKGENPLGPGAARNLGIKACQSEFLAFLDADDVYLAQRFRDSLSYLQANPDVEGYYVATEKRSADLSTSLGFKRIRTEVEPKQLLVALIIGKHGFFHTSGILLRRSVFRKAGYFNEALRWHQDTEFFLRLSFFCCLKGQVEGPPLVYNRQHSGNHSKLSDRASSMLLWQSSLLFFNKQKTGPYLWYLLLLRLAIVKYNLPTKRAYLGLIPLFFRYPQYFWIWLRKWIVE